MRAYPPATRARQRGLHRTRMALLAQAFRLSTKDPGRLDPAHVDALPALRVLAAVTDSVRNEFCGPDRRLVMYNGGVAALFSALRRTRSLAVHRALLDVAANLADDPDVRAVLLKMRMPDLFITAAAQTEDPALRQRCEIEIAAQSNALRLR
jgi:hypothetical protein